MPRRLTCLLGVALLLAGGRPAVAQSRLEITPVLGAYLALSNVIELSDGTTAKQETAWVAGARFSVVPQGAFGFEGSLLYTPSDVGASAGATGGPSSLVLANVRGVWMLGSHEARTRLYLAAGAALVTRRGEFYQVFESRTDLGGNVAAGLRVALGRVQGRVEAESYLYSVDLSGSGGSSQSTGSQFQADLVLSAAVAIPLGG